MLCPKTEPFFPWAVSSIAAQPQNGLFLGKQIGHFCLVLGNLFNIKAAHDSQRYTCGIFMQICILCLCMPYAKLVIITSHMHEMLNIIWEECDTFWEIHKSRLQMWDTIPYFWKLEKMWSCNKSDHYQSNAMGKNFTFLSMLNQTDHLKGDLKGDATDRKLNRRWHIILRKHEKRRILPISTIQITFMLL